MEHKKWTCPKCQHRKFEVGEFSATGGFFTKFFNIQNKRFTTVSCKRCEYTEVYRTSTSNLANVLDFFGN